MFRISYSGKSWIGCVILLIFILGSRFISEVLDLDFGIIGMASIVIANILIYFLGREFNKEKSYIDNETGEMYSIKNEHRIMNMPMEKVALFLGGLSFIGLVYFSFFHN